MRSPLVHRSWQGFLIVLVLVLVLVLERTGCGCERFLSEWWRGVRRRNGARGGAWAATVPILPPPADLWISARILGQKCIDAGSLPPAIDLLIAQIGLHHNVPITTFDSHFQQIAKVSSLQVNFLMRAK